MDITALMHRPRYTIAPETPWRQAQELMQRYGIRYVPVLQNDIPVGLLSTSQLCWVTPSAAPALARHEWTDRLVDLRVQDVMTRQLCTVPTDTPVSQAMQVLQAMASDCLLVTDRKRLVGLVTTEDILAALFTRLEAQGPARYEHILTAIDCRAPSASVLRTALALARQHGASLTVVHVLPFVGTYMPLDLDHGSPTMFTAYREEGRMAALEQLTACIPRQHDVPVHVQVVEGEPWIAIVRLGAKLAADLIVIGEGQRCRGMLSAQQAAMVGRYAPCPVLRVEES